MLFTNERVNRTIIRSVFNHFGINLIGGAVIALIVAPQIYLPADTAVLAIVN